MPLLARILLVLVLGASSLAGAVRPARADINPDVRTLLVGSGYGLVGGTILGLLSYPLHRSARSVFIGSAVGMYLGGAVGVYHMAYRDDPRNPFVAEAGGERPVEFNWTLARF